MKVIELMSTDDYSGAENVSINIYHGIKEKSNIEIYYATRKGKILDVLKEKKVQNVIIIDKLSIKNIKKIEQEYKPDIIHAHDYKASLISAVAVKKAKVIAHIHNNSPWIKKIYHPYVWAFLFASMKMKKILTVSDSIEKEYVFSKLIKNKIVNVGNPVSVKSVIEKVTNKGISKKYDVCFVGRLTKQKNPIKFISIIKELKNTYPEILAVMVGDGELKQDCIDEINKYNLQDNIKLAGFQKNPYNFMNESKIFCLTSDWEGYGLVAFEAISLGLPAVVSNVGGLPDIVDNKCGKLSDTDQEFIKEIKELLNEKNYYLLKSNSAKEKANKIDNYDKYIKKIKDLYKDVGNI